MRKTTPIAILIILSLFLAPTYKVTQDAIKIVEKTKTIKSISEKTIPDKPTQRTLITSNKECTTYGEYPTQEIQGEMLPFRLSIRTNGKLKMGEELNNAKDKQTWGWVSPIIANINVEIISGTPPPSSGDWNITDVTVVENQVVIVNGSIFVLSGGALVLKNSTIYMKLDRDGEHWIEVFDGGNLTVINSTITPYNLENHYYIKINRGAKLRIEGSEISYAGYMWESNGGKTGIWINTDNAIIKNTKIQDNFLGVYLWNSHNATIENNVFINSGLFVVDSYDNVVMNNTVNGKPLVYLEDKSGIEVTSAGQVVLVNSTDITLTNLELTNIAVGIEIWGSYNVKVYGNNISNNRVGLYLWNAYSNVIYGNNISNNELGVSLGNSYNNSIYSNYLSNNSLVSVFLYSSYRNAIFEDNIVDSALGIYLEGSYNNTIHENNIINNWNGLHLSYSNNNTIYGNNISGNRLYGVFPKSSCCNTIRENNINNNENGLYSQDSHSNTVYWNNLSHNKVGVYLERSHDNTFYGNNISNSEYGVRLYYSHNNTICGSDMSHNEYGIHLGNSYGNVIYRNTLNNNSLDGIHLEYSNNNTIYKNNISENNLNGVYLGDSHNNTIRGNSIHNSNEGDAVHLEYSHNNTIHGNDITNNEDGIFLGESYSNTIYENIIDNNGNGIHLYYSLSNKIYGNNVTNNKAGIYLESSHRNIIYLNNFVTNQHQAYDYGVNVFDYNGYGNYWDDYPGGDNDGDLIGDTPYKIDSDSIDHNPLVVPVRVYSENIYYLLTHLVTQEGNTYVKAKVITSMSIEKVYVFYKVEGRAYFLEMKYDTLTNTYYAEIQGTNIVEIKLVIKILGVPFVDNPPTIEHVSWEPENPVGGEEVNVTAYVSDDYGVNLVILSYYDGSWHNVTMMYDSEKNVYRAKIPGYPAGTTIEFKVYANDTTGNWAVSDTYQVVFAQGTTGGQPVEGGMLFIFIGILVSVILLISVFAIRFVRNKRS